MEGKMMLPSEAVVESMLVTVFELMYSSVFWTRKKVEAEQTAILKKKDEHRHKSKKDGNFHVLFYLVLFLRFQTFDYKKL
jgi:hypothetical protein